MRRLRPAVKRCGVACMKNFILPHDREESRKMEAAIVLFMTEIKILYKSQTLSYTNFSIEYDNSLGLAIKLSYSC